jgi:hypothetical protein
MTVTTAEKPRAGKRSRVEILEAAIEERRQKLAGSLREIADLAGREDQAAAESLRADPSKSAFAVRTPASELRRKRGELEKSVANLEKELTLLGGELGAASAEEAAQELRERAKRARQLAERERTLRREAGEAFGALIEHWNALADCLSERSALAVEVAGEQLIERVGLFDREARERWEEAAAFTVEPVPVDLRSFLDELLEASTGERVDIEAEHRAIDELNARRREIAKRDPGGMTDLPPVAKPVIRPNPLHELVPDLRGEVRHAEVSGVTVRRRQVEGWPAGGAAA